MPTAPSPVPATTEKPPYPARRPEGREGSERPVWPAGRTGRPDRVALGTVLVDRVRRGPRLQRHATGGHLFVPGCGLARSRASGWAR
ncbi:hypothetical protein AB0C52_09940 [Streptomyces sp. NPDC048717]|uniref:hypothetical protein n=1 Tax=Streptomyces sp. NPDC048717 TaxID=3154928 RepID=UPI003417BA15